MQTKYHTMHCPEDYVLFKINGSFIHVMPFYMENTAEINGILDKLSKYCKHAFVLHMVTLDANIQVAVVGANEEIGLWAY